MTRNSFFQSGLVALVLAVFLMIYGIPSWVATPSNIPRILSPLFWPQILCMVLGIVGIGLIIISRNQLDTHDTTATKGGYLRLTLFAVLLIIYTYAIPRIGMVWASMLAFIALTYLIKNQRRTTAFIAAILIPLSLYIFFAHVAGINIPQGDFVRLP
jgi:putative tricarboxylic transport membrane protein